MKRSILFLGLCIALGLGITTTLKASGKKFIKVCCDQNTGVCQRISATEVLYGPDVYQLNQCP
ncbi:hypothetical protein [Chitinophaga barathri]|uniref:Uncharacterized protein n=1 Tax=Chitinophaga barathri TaxID=1647451 RepID=A0A3N4MUV2_9BACT|nr:hypothetical protein [Chitinophaga barathri]RPD39233.1 hypothetical protein EG028_21725 [Chitinophaga barathri]